MNDLISQIKSLKIIPVVTIENSTDASPLADALIEGGLPCAEITLRTDAGLDALKLLSQNRSMLVGAGTVLTVDQASKALNAGAQFIISPGFNPKVVQYCLDSKTPVFPGIATPTDISMAMDFGLEILKFFPAEAFGGIKTLKSLSAPFPMVEFIPTGGINETNINDYLALEEVIACGGSFMVKTDWIRKGHFDKVIEASKNAIKRLRT